MPFLLPVSRAIICAASVMLFLSACQGTSATRSGTASITENEKNLLTKGDIARARGKQEEAIGYYREAAAASHGAIRAHLELADIYTNRQDMQAALDIMQAAYTLNPTHAEVLKNYAQQLLLANQNEKALEIATKGLEKNPDDVRLLNIAGIAHDRNGQHDKAQEHYKKAMPLAVAAIDKEYTANNLALSYVASKRYDLAIALLQEQMPTAKNQPALRQLLALAYGAKGNTDKAYELGLMDLNVTQIAENLEFYKQLRDGKIDASILFTPAIR